MGSVHKRTQAGTTSWLARATAAGTLDTYAHLWPDSDDRTREAIDSVLGAAESTGTAGY